MDTKTNSKKWLWLVVIGVLAATVVLLAERGGGETLEDH